MDAFGEQAKNLWKKLDQLHAADPNAYRDFLARQRDELMADKKLHSQDEFEELASEISANPALKSLLGDPFASSSKSSKSSALSSSSKSSSQPPQSPLPSPTQFIPEPGFALKTKRIDIDNGPVFYLNLCHSTQVQDMHHQSGRPAKDSDPINQLVIPLSVGGLKKMKERTKAGPIVDVLVCDVVVNPSIVKRCADLGFRLPIVEMALTHVEQDHKMKLHRGYQFINSVNYKGPKAQSKPNAQLTQEALKDIEQIGKAMETLASQQEGKQKGGDIAMPSFVKGAPKEDDADAILDLNLRLRKTNIAPNSKTSSSSSSSASSSSSSSSSTKPAPDIGLSAPKIIRKNPTIASTSPPSSSSSSSSSSKPSSLTSRPTSSPSAKKPLIQVLDGDDVLEDATTPSSASAPSLPVSIAADGRIVGSSTAKRDEKPLLQAISVRRLDQQSSSSSSSYASSSSSAPSLSQSQSQPRPSPLQSTTSSQNSIVDMDISPSLSSSSSSSSSSSKMTIHAQTSSSSPPQQQASCSSSSSVVSSAASSQPTTKRRTPEYGLSCPSGGEELVVKISLPGVTSAAEIDADIGERRLVLSNAVYYLDIPFPMPVDDATARAKFNKKKAQLTITIKRAM